MEPHHKLKTVAIIKNHSNLGMICKTVTEIGECNSNKNIGLSNYCRRPL